VSDTFSIFTEAADQFFRAPAWLLLAAVVIAFGYFLKALPWVPNHFIPASCALFGAVVLPLIANPAALSPDQRNPRLVFALMGFVIAMVAWAIHGMILKRVEQRLGIFQSDEGISNDGKPTNKTN
jgi:hypothetical protein